MSKSSAHRILQDLVSSGFASSDHAGRYAAGPRLVALASEVLGEELWTHRIASVMEELRLDFFTVHFAIRSELEVVYVQKANPNQAYQISSRIGSRIPLHSTAIGKCVLAWLGEDELEALWPRLKLTSRTPSTLTSRGALEAELATTGTGKASRSTTRKMS